jgi:predicted phage-related endonuclease
MKTTMWKKNGQDRRSFIGGSDARIIMGNDEVALVRLWREKRGEVEPEDLSANLIVQLGSVTEDLNRRWYELNSGQVIIDIQRRVRHPAVRWMAATLDGRVEGQRGGVRSQIHAAVVVLGGGGRCTLVFLFASWPWNVLLLVAVFGVPRVDLAVEKD